MDALKILMLYILSSLLFACDHPEKIKGHRSLSNVDAAVAHKERPVEDVQRDKIRSPQKVLAFFDIQQGDEVVELLASNGYYTELLSRCVGRSGKVYMHNNERYFEFQTDKNVKERLANNRLSNVVRWDQELSNLKFKESSIDKVLMILVFHDFYWMEENVDRVIKQIFNTLKPDGILGIVDHSAEENSGIKHAQDIKGIHRIEEAYVIKTMLAHGFIFDGESNALNQANDNGTQAFFSDQFKGKPTNRFMLRFRKPPVH